MSSIQPLNITQGAAGTETPVGFAAREQGRFRVTTTDVRLAELDGEVFDDARAAQRLAEAMLAARDIGPGLATGGSAASRVLFALLHRAPASEALSR